MFGCGRRRATQAGLAVVIIGIAVHGIGADGPASDPWRLSDLSGFPGWLDLSGEQRTRYETLDGQFRLGRRGGDQMLAFRTTFRAAAVWEGVSVVGELADSRQALADGGTPLNTTMVNAVELLQGYVGLGAGGRGRAGVGWPELRLGRQTLNLGSRRLVARNRFRNTMNAFNGVWGRWRTGSGVDLQAFYFLPVTRLPWEQGALLENGIRLDEESWDLRFWGLHADVPAWVSGMRAEVYLLGLREDGLTVRPSRDRDLWTPGLRLFRAPADGRWDADLEAAVQWGRTGRSPFPEDLQDENVFAWFGHAEAGYTVEAPWAPRVAVLFDHASGDDEPGDGRQNRFDTLYGARRFEHGPTGIYGAFARSNILSPGYTLELSPSKGVSAAFGHRFYWLASATDAWTTSGLRDRTGRSGRRLGQQLEVRVRWDVVPGNIRVEAGWAHLFAGSFQDRVPGVIERGDTSYGYGGITFRF